MFDTMGISISPTTEAASMFNHLVFLHRGDVESFTNRFINKSYDTSNLEFIYNNNTLHYTVFNNRYIHDRVGLERAESAVANAFSKMMRGDNVITMFDNVAIIVIEDDLESEAYLENCVSLAVDMIKDEATEETVNFDFLVLERNVFSKIKGISNKLWANLIQMFHNGRAVFIMNRA